MKALAGAGPRAPNAAGPCCTRADDHVLGVRLLVVPLHGQGQRGKPPQAATVRDRRRIGPVAEQQRSHAVKALGHGQQQNLGLGLKVVS